MIGFIVALEREAEHVINQMCNTTVTTIALKKVITGEFNGKQCVLAVTGIGKVNSALTTQMIIDRFSPNYIVNFGTAGGLDPNMKVCDFYAVEKCCQFDFDLSELDNCPRGYIQDYDTVYFTPYVEKLGFMKKGVLASGDRFTNGEADIIIIKNTLSGNLRDMEGGAVAQVCYSNNVPLVMLKGLTDIFGNEQVSKQFYSNLKTVCEQFPQAVKKITDAVGDTFDK